MDAPVAGGGIAGLVGPEAIRFLKGLFERRGDGLRSIFIDQLANPSTTKAEAGYRKCGQVMYKRSCVPGGAIVAITPDEKIYHRSEYRLCCSGSCSQEDWVGVGISIKPAVASMQPLLCTRLR